jgi:hypothetical protein
VKDPAEKNHLMNVYVVRPDGEPAVIRSSKIDSKEKAEEFVSLLQEIRDDIRKETGNKDYQLRVASEQFNSFDFGREASMINNQHTWLAYANDKMQKEGIGELLHISMPANSFYFISQKVRKFGSVGKFLEKHTVNGEIRSRNQNLDSWGTYLRWTTQDFESVIEELNKNGSLGLHAQKLNRLATNYLQGTKILSGQIALHQGFAKIHLINMQRSKEKMASAKKELKEALRNKNPTEMGTALEKLAKAKSEVDGYKKDLKQERSILRSLLEKQHHQLTELENGLNLLISEGSGAGLNGQIFRVKKPISLMRQILGSQLDIPGNSNQQKVSRGKEFLLLQELNESLGVTSAGNCKGGA